ncbi:MAG: Hsp33 family molecular chaperone HslO [Myxococcota bacterium]|nr:Hsp33 family molecular chaperone HslO [Myxococcota bacterium]
MQGTEGAPDERDRAVTTVAEDGSFRVITVRSTHTVSAAIAAQRAKGRSAEHLADLITGSVLVRLTMAPDLRVQSLVRGQTGKGTIVADCHPDGSCRGMVRETAGPIEVGPGSLVQMTRSLPNGTLHQGIVEVPETYGISGALMVYMLQSEQVTSVIGVGCVMSEDEQVAVAGGWIVQLLPECKEPPLEVMYQRMRLDFSDVKSVLRTMAGDPDAMQSEILYGMPYQTTGTAEIAHRCQCSPERVFASLATLGREELDDIVRKGETLFISCDYCGRPYEILAESLRGLIEAS